MERKFITKKKAGRPPGTRSMIIKLAEKKARMAGKMPRDLLLEWAQTGVITHREPSGQIIKTQLTTEQRIDVAKAAAPYFNARLASVQANLSNSVPALPLLPENLTGLTHEQLLFLEHLLARVSGQSGSLPGVGGSTARAVEAASEEEREYEASLNNG